MNNNRTLIVYFYYYFDNVFKPVMRCSFIFRLWFIRYFDSDLSDAELLVGALTESNIPNGIFGPTLSCIADIQFENIKRGDRFWYSNQNFDASFTNGWYLKIIRLFWHIIKRSREKIFLKYKQLIYYKSLRFYVEKSFTFADQLKELKQVTISSLICSNLNDYMKSVQENAFLKFDPIM